MTACRTALAALSMALSAGAQAQWVTLTDVADWGYDDGQVHEVSIINKPLLVEPQPATCTQSGLPPTVPVRAYNATRPTARFAGLPGSAAMPGYVATPIRESVATLNTGGVDVGTLYERVYCKGSGATCDGSGTYVFASRAILNANVVPATGKPFQLFAIFRRVWHKATGVQVGYYMGRSGGAVPGDSPAVHAPKYAARTNVTAWFHYGWRPNANFVAFRVFATASDPDRCEPYTKNSPTTPWVYTQMNCAHGVSAAPLAEKLKLRQGSVVGDGDPTNIRVSGFACN